MEQDTDGIFLLDDNGNFTSINNGLAEITGTTKKELLNKPLWSLSSPQNSDKIFKAYKKALSGVPQKFEEKFITPKGAIVVLAVSLSGKYREEGVDKIFGIAKDLTQLRRAESALEASAKRFGALIQQGSDMISILDSNGIFKCVSENSFSILGLKPAHFIDKFFFGFIHPEDISNLQSEFEDLKKSGEQKQQIFRIKNGAGNWRWMETKAMDLRHEPNINGIVVSTRDITENFLSTRALEESEQKYRAFFENSLDGIILAAPTGEIFAANPAACKMLQMEEEEICKVGREGIVDSTDPRLQEALRLRKTNGRVESELTYIKKDGSKFPVEVTSSIYKGANNEERSSIIIRDVTQKKEVEEKLRRSREKYKSLFDYSPLPNWIYDNETFRIEAVNKAAIKQYGYSREEFLKLKVTDLKPEDEIPEFITLKKNRRESGLSRYGKVKHLTKNGEIKINDILAYRFSETSKTLVVSQDLTEWEQVQENLKDKSNKLQIAQKIGRLGYWELNFVDGSYYWSDEVYEIWERSKEFFKSGAESFYETVHPDDVEILKQKQDFAFEGKEELDVEHRILVPDGRIKWVHEKGHVKRDKAGNIVGYQGSVQDVTEYKTAIEKLQVSEARQASLLQSQTSYLIRTDLNGDYIYCNEKFKKDFNWIFSDGEILGKCAFATFKDYHHDKVKEIFERCIENPNTVFQVEIDKVQRKNKVKPTLWEFICLANSAGEPIEVQAVGIDITNRIQTEQKIREANRRYELVTKATSDAIWDWNGKTDELFWGQGFKNLFGYSSLEEAPNVRYWHELIHPEDAAKVIANLNRVLGGSKDCWEAEYRFRKADGEYAHVRDRSYIIRDDEGKPVRMVGAMQDVTQQRLSLERILSSEAQQRQLVQEKERILESIGDAFYTMDHDWVVTYWNSEAERILECSRKKIVGRKLVEFFDIRNTVFEAYYNKAAQENETQHFEAFYEGTNSWYEVSAYPSGDGLSVFFKDVTGQKETKFKLKKLNEDLQKYTEELVTANKGLEQFSYIISHNLRAPVANIMGLANLLENDNPEDVQTEILNGLVDNVKRLDKVMYDLNHILQVKNEFSEKKEPISLQELVFSIESSLQNIIEKEQVKIESDFSECAELTSVPGYIYSIFFNLIFNSIKYRRPGVNPLIKISTKAKGDKVIIFFEDNGIGIDLNKRKDQIFGLYKRFHHHVEGKGMGLFMVKTQVEMLGGRISVSSKVGEGTTFTIELKEFKLINNKDRNEAVYSS